LLGESVIGKDLSIEGQGITVRCKGSLRVNGAIAADLHCVELVVGQEAVINGSIAAEKVRVFGQINGAILGANVVLHPSAHVEGDIHSQQLTIEQGATFEGRSRKVSNAEEVAPQLEGYAAHAS
jgi:cytoskeletal protein CcmA (bactofilin family)